ncbi:hypothetical protein [Runella sp.]|uniref:hypothetical protein n=1 Tax=Runella sp. TaxID=1960881 RepID=UPI003D141461
MKNLFNNLFYATTLMLLTGGCLKSPFESRVTTVYGSIIDNNTNLPVDSVEVTILGMSGSIRPVSDVIKTVYTDKTGTYNVTVDVPKEFHSINVEIYTRNRYKDFLLFLNGQSAKSCCIVEVGATAQYDYRLIPR